MTLRTRMDAAARNEIAVFHRPYWEALKQQQDVSVYSTVFRASIARLVEQGYCASDIAMMFGVSRERARQWFMSLGLDPHFGTKPRVWDPERGHFVAVALGELRDEALRAGQRQRRAAKKAEFRRRWCAAIKVLREITAAGRRPTAQMLARKLFPERGFISSASATPALVSYLSLGVRRAANSAPRYIVSRLYRVSGIPRAPWCRGWRPARLSQKERNTVVALRRREYTHKQIASTVGCSVTTVRNVLKSVGCK